MGCANPKLTSIEDWGWEARRSVGAPPAVLMGLFLSTWAIGTAVARAEGQSTGSQAGFVKLYNGKDLSGWEAQHGKLTSWKANGELLQCVAPGGGWLRTANMYSDFVLRLQYRI